MLLLAACAPPCTSFADMALTNPDGRAPVEVVDEVRAAIDEFAAWSARDGLCVEEVRLVEEIEDPDGDPVGRFSGDLIRIEHTKGGSFDALVHHELCHAADYQAGYYSETRADWFGEEDPHEAFAELCESGPRAAAWLSGVEAACGDDLGGARQEHLNELVYGAAELSADTPDGTVATRLDRVRVRRLPGPVAWAPVAGGAAVYLEAPRVEAKRSVYADLVQVVSAELAGRRTCWSSPTRRLRATRPPAASGSPASC